MIRKNKLLKQENIGINFENIGLVPKILVVSSERREKWYSEFII